MKKRRLAKQKRLFYKVIRIIPQGLTLIFLHKRVFLGAEFDAKRGTGQVKLFAEEPFEIAALRFANIFKSVTVNHDHRRIRAPLVSKARLRTTTARARRLLTFDGFKERTG